MFEEDEELCLFFQDYSERRFDNMGIAAGLQFAEFFRQIGLWNWNLNLMGQLHSHFERNSIDYEMTKLCTLVKLIGSNHKKDEGFLSLIEETVNMRVQHSLKSDSQLDLSTDAMKDLTEGMSRLSMSRKRMNTLLKTIIILEARKGRNMLA